LLRRDFQDPDNASVVAACLLWREGAAAEGPTAISSEELSEILFSAQGVTKTISVGSETLDLRTAPSAGALYPINVYLVVWRAGALEPGVYYYHPKQSSLIRVRADSQAAWMLNEASGQPGAWGNAEAALVLTATFERSAYKYAERSYRYVCIDAGHAAGNATLCAASLCWRAPLIARFR
jgi:SagB-type dehydrogenase family enzyme